MQEEVCSKLYGQLENIEWFYSAAEAWNKETEGNFFQATHTREVELGRDFLATRLHTSFSIRGCFVTYFMGVEHLLKRGIIFTMQKWFIEFSLR